LLSPNSSEKNDSDEWEPLPLDRSSAAYAEAIEASEAALKEIEVSNGYASSEPDERNAIVSTIKGTLEAIKTGFPSKRAIVHGILKPIEYVAKKFPDAAIGTVARIAVTKLLAWLGTLLG
jgi:hypothetical protein